MTFAHQPVLIEETIAALRPRPGGRYVDGTLGGGGHAEAIMRGSDPDGELVGIDRDPGACRAAAARLQPFGRRARVVRGNYSRMAELVRDAAPHWFDPASGPPGADGVLLDLGVSSPQLDEAGRGFSYQHDAPLDMRMDPELPRTAADLVNEEAVESLVRILRGYGEERWATRIAKFIDRARRQARIQTTGQLVELIKAAIPAAARRAGGHPARRTFQALRIAVNDELGALRAGLEQAIDLLRPGGRAAVISFHSLEDRICKETFQAKSRGCTCPPDQPVCTCGGKPTLRLVHRKPITAGPDELQTNPRSRSAKLRVAERLATTGGEGDIG